MQAASPAMLSLHVLANQHCTPTDVWPPQATLHPFCAAQRVRATQHHALVCAYLSADAGHPLQVGQQVLGQRRDHLVRQRVPRAELPRRGLPARIMRGQSLVCSRVHCNHLIKQRVPRAELPRRGLPACIIMVQSLNVFLAFIATTSSGSACRVQNSRAAACQSPS